MDGILKLYLDSVLPKALASVTVGTRNLQPHVESIQQIFDQLKIEVTHCVSTRVFPRTIPCVMLRSASPRCSAALAHTSLFFFSLHSVNQAF